MKLSDKNNNWENLNVKGRSQKKEANRKSKSQSRSKSKNGKKDYRNVRCFHYNKTSHIQRFFLENMK